MYFEPFDEGSMYRQGLFQARCRLLAYRYKEIRSGNTYLSDSYEATAKDTARLVNKAQRLYLEKLSGVEEDIDKLNRTRFIEALREVREYNITQYM